MTPKIFGVSARTLKTIDKTRQRSQSIKVRLHRLQRSLCIISVSLAYTGWQTVRWDDISHQIISIQRGNIMLWCSGDPHCYFHFPPDASQEFFSELEIPDAMQAHYCICHSAHWYCKAKLLLQDKIRSKSSNAHVFGINFYFLSKTSPQDGSCQKIRNCVYLC